jgi:F-type H+-transporting ATPase subunit a
MSRITSRFSTRNIIISSLFTLIFLAGNFNAIASHDEKLPATAVETLQHEEKVLDSSLVDGAEHVAAEIVGVHGEQEEKFNTSKVIMEHIADGHDWHLWGHTSIHLPVILYTDKGIECFSSGKFNHGHDAYTGKNYTYSIVENKVKIVTPDGQVNEEASSHLIDFSITKNVASMMVSMFFCF